MMNTTECPNDLCNCHTEHSNECYECGALILKESGWISVKDRLPKNDDEVLVSTRLKNIGIGWWDSYWRSDLSVKEITHWMPMPAPPEEER
jgi:hypothetical protein